MSNLNLITDRTAADVTAVNDLATAIKNGTATAVQVEEYLNTLQKGAYTAADLNRVGDAVMYVAGELAKYGYMPVQPYTRTWTVEDKPNERDFAVYFGNVAAIRAALPVWNTTPPCPTDVTGFDVNKANDLEKILLDVEDIITRMKDAWFYSGDLYLAEV